MTITLNKPLARNRVSDETDMRAIKNALNRLGYYTPYEAVGMTEWPDDEIFDAIQQFQKDKGLPASGIIKPEDKNTDGAQRSTQERTGRLLHLAHRKRRKSTPGTRRT